MNGVDPAPQDVSLEESLLSRHRVKAFLYNAAGHRLADRIVPRRRDPRRHPGGRPSTRRCRPAYDYQSWMLAEVGALQKAVAKRISTARL